MFDIIIVKIEIQYIKKKKKKKNEGQENELHIGKQLVWKKMMLGVKPYFIATF